MDANDPETELSKLRAEIAVLRKLAPLSSDFTAWLGRLFEFVKAQFGNDSAEMRELREISPELPSEFFDATSNKLESLPFEQKHKDQLLAKLNSEVPKSIFDKRLYEYDEFITGLIYLLNR